MENALIHYCRHHALQVPKNKAETVRCVLQSLAFKYRQAVEQLNHCLPSPIRQLNIIGGGSQNQLLNQLTADELGIPVYAGPVEATAMGNILTQAMAKGEIADLRELREIVIVGGNERMVCQYEDICKGFGCKAKVFAKEKGAMKKQSRSKRFLFTVHKIILKT